MARPLVYPSLVSTLLVPTVAEREKREQLLFPTYTSVPHPPSIILHLIAPMYTREPESPPTPAYGTAYVAIRVARAGSLSLRMY
jgi:hypothetical protein